MRIVGRPETHALGVLVPVANLYFLAKWMVELAQSFGKHHWLDHVLVIVFNAFYVLNLGLAYNEEYEGPVYTKGPARRSPDSHFPPSAGEQGLGRVQRGRDAVGILAAGSGEERLSASATLDVAAPLPDELSGVPFLFLGQFLGDEARDGRLAAGPAAEDRVERCGLRLELEGDVLDGPASKALR